MEFRKRFRRKRPALFKPGQWHFQQDNAPVHNSILVTDYLTKMVIKTLPRPPYSPDVAPCDFWLFPELTGCRYETIEEMKRLCHWHAHTKDFHGAFQKLLERYNKCIAAGGDYFEGDKSFMCILSIKVPKRKKSWNLFNGSRNLFILSLIFVKYITKKYCIINFLYLLILVAFYRNSLGLLFLRRDIMLIINMQKDQVSMRLELTSTFSSGKPSYTYQLRNNEGHKYCWKLNYNNISSVITSGNLPI